ncbi:MAG: DUF134 domain-containing protein [Clostridiales bacterium]|jgi:predicted DNA-binding protein (UPF0251 family)|nr:DUF134 domain-containing protein [Clostridiales bacterium]
MARPTKLRRIENLPSVEYFLPSDKGTAGYTANVLKLEELEAIRLKDLEGLEQEECAERMQVSRPTFFRILSAAREKVADSLVNGKAIQIEGGNFTLNICPVRCLKCGKEWDEGYENLEAIRNNEYSCPACGSTDITCIQKHGGKYCRRHCRRRGRGGKGRS